MAKFTVDTHLFRELGELLVSRESTALVELIKNAYDADATAVTVYGEHLDDPARATIIITDDGNGMTPSVFETGFLRIASRGKDGRASHSPRLKRRFTGAKGVGRLAAHKLAWRIDVQSVPDRRVYGQDAKGVAATIDWKKVESVDSLEKVEQTGGVSLTPFTLDRNARHGTKISLSNLKRRWSDKQRSDFFAEIDSFLPPSILTEDISKVALGRPLFKIPRVRDEAATGARFVVERLGDLDVGDEQQANVITAADWVVEIDCQAERNLAHVALLPTKKFISEFPSATARRFEIPLSADADVSFHARILFQGLKSWARPGVRIYQEGFRVLPYGEARNDWLELDVDYKRRGRTLRFLDRVPELSVDDTDKNLGLSIAGNSSYLGAVFLRTEASKSLRMLVNREGFEWSVAFENVKSVVRTALDLLVRERAAYTLDKRQQRSETRKGSPVSAIAPPRTRLESVINTVESTNETAKRLLAEGDTKGALKALASGTEIMREAIPAYEALITDSHATRILAALGLQLSAYIHEIKNLLVMVRDVAERTASIRRAASGTVKQLVVQLDNRVGELKRSVERQTQYLSDVTSADARRRRSKQPIGPRLAAVYALYEREAEMLGITLENAIDPSLKTPVPMFSAELILIFSNLVSNAIKAAGKEGTVRASAKALEGKTLVKIENSGAGVILEEGERWFKPFQSSVSNAEIFFGQGMGMGLPITRELLEDYGATIGFVAPSSGFATAVQMELKHS